MTIAEWQESVHALARMKGWYDGSAELNIPEKLALIHAEISEALEDYRNGAMETTVDADGKPSGFPTELADVVIRALDLAEALGIKLESAIIAKHNYNATRPYRHGGKRC